MNKEIKTTIDILALENRSREKFDHDLKILIDLRRRQPLDINRPEDATKEELEMIVELEKNAKTEFEMNLEEIMKELWP